MRTNEYEAMFLLENNAATADFDGTAGQVDEILQKHGAELVEKEKWDERKLAYEIKGHRRATYYLVYLRAPPASLQEIEVDLGLNEIVLRHLFINLEEPIATHIEKRANERELLAEDSRKHSLSGWGRRDRRSKRDSGGPRRSDDAPQSGDAGGDVGGDAKPAAVTPAAATAQAEKPAAEKPEAAKPAAEKPEAAKPAAEKTEAAKPEAAKPEAAKDETPAADAVPTTTEGTTQA